MTEKVYAIDFDGTCVTHMYPKLGRDIGAAAVLTKMVARGDKLVLNTMRSGEALLEAVEWFKTNGLPLFGVNTNPQQKRWTSSPKVYANVYIDDAALGCPLIYPTTGERPYVDWSKVAQLLGIVNVTKIAPVNQEEWI